jgi:hypothetical protein
MTTPYDAKIQFYRTIHPALRSSAECERLRELQMDREIWLARMFECGCGSVVKTSGINAHFRSKKHTKFEQAKMESLGMWKKALDDQNAQA